MKIEEKMIAEKSVVGKTPDGDPVVMILTHGGLYAFFAKTEHGIETLGMAPHKAIAVFFAEKKAGSIKWKDDFVKSEDTELQVLRKNNDTMFNRLRNLIFSPVVLAKNTTNEDYYLLYDTKSKNIGLMHKDEIKEGIQKNEIGPLWLVRNINLTEKVQLIESHEVFRG